MRFRNGGGCERMRVERRGGEGGEGLVGKKGLVRKKGFFSFFFFMPRNPMI